MSSQIQKNTDFADKQLTALKMSNNQALAYYVDNVGDMYGNAGRNTPRLSNIQIESSRNTYQRQTCILDQILHSKISKKFASQSPHQSFQNLNSEQEQNLPFLGGRLISTDENENVKIKICGKCHQDDKVKYSEISQQIDFENNIKVSQILNKISIKNVQPAYQNPQNNADMMRKKIEALQSKVQILQQKVQILQQRVFYLQSQKKQTSISNHITLKKLIQDKKQNSLMIQKYQRIVKQLQEQNSILKNNYDCSSALDQSLPFMSQLHQKSQSLFIKKLHNKINLNKSSPNISFQKQSPPPPLQKKYKIQANQNRAATLVRILKQLTRIIPHLSQSQKNDLKNRLGFSLA